MKSKNSLYKFSVVCLLVLFSAPVFSQNTENSLDALYVPPATSTFDEDANGGGGGDDGIYHDHKNVIYFNPLLLTRSIGALHYQRNFGDLIAAYVGLGSAYGKDFLMVVGFETGTELFDNDYVEHDVSDIMFSGDLSSSLNLFFNTGVEFYHDSFWGFEYGYVAFDYRLASQDFDYEAQYTQQSSSNFSGTTYVDATEEIVVDVTSHNFNFIFGTETGSSGNVGVYHSFYWGFGLRSTLYDEIAELSTGSTVIGVPTLTGNKASKVSGSFLVGYKFGIGW